MELTTQPLQLSLGHRMPTFRRPSPALVSIAILGLILCLLAGGCGVGSLLITPVQNTNTLEEEQVQPGEGFASGKIIIIPVEGMLSDQRSGGVLQPTENPLSLFDQELLQAARDPSVKAIVLRVNSPGGTVTASDTMYQLLQRFKATTHKPVVASMQEVAASGAYYVSCGADKIVAEPTSIVGSIGVIFESFNISGTLKTIGVNPWEIVSGSLKDMGSPFKSPGEPTGNERQVMQEMVQEYFSRFLNIVRINRPVAEPIQSDLSVYHQRGYAGMYSGRVYSGSRAVKLGLVDQTGLLEDAIDLARKMAHAPGAQVVMYRRPYSYGGSIYAASSIPTPKSNVMQLALPGQDLALPGGVYYLWQP